MMSLSPRKGIFKSGVGWVGVRKPRFVLWVELSEYFGLEFRA